MRNRVSGLIAVLWGGVIMVYALVSGATHHSWAYHVGQIAGCAFGVLLFGVGLVYLIRGAGNQPPPPHVVAPAGSVPPPIANLVTSDVAVASLMLGIVALLCLGPLAGIPAIICGHLARRRIRQAPNRLRGQGMALAGLILGYVASILFVLVVTTVVVVTARARAEAQKRACQAEIQQTLGRIFGYAAAHQGEFPPDLAAVPPPAGSTKCTCTHDYFGAGLRGLRNRGSVATARRTVLLADRPGNHWGVMHALTLGGEVVSGPYRNVDALLRARNLSRPDVAAINQAYDDEARTVCRERILQRFYLKCYWAATNGSADGDPPPPRFEQMAIAGGTVYQDFPCLTGGKYTTTPVGQPDVCSLAGHRDTSAAFRQELENRKAMASTAVCAATLQLIASRARSYADRDPAHKYPPDLATLVAAARTEKVTPKNFTCPALRGHAPATFAELNDPEKSGYRYCGGGVTQPPWEKAAKLILIADRPGNHAGITCVGMCAGHGAAIKTAEFDQQLQQGRMQWANAAGD